MKKLFISLGCDKNLVDTEVMLGLLSKSGYTFTDDETQADIIAINTCCFIGDAKEESINTILEMAEYKKNGKCKALVVAGCLAQRYKDEIVKEIPEVDAIVGTSSFDKIVEVVDEVIKGKKKDIVLDPSRLPEVINGRVITTGGYYSYLKIAEGCDKYCTYCIIPKVRGHYRSIPMEKIIESAKELVSKGVKEINLVAQETTLYGTDIYGKKALPDLLRELSKIDGLYLIRILYCYP